MKIDETRKFELDVSSKPNCGLSGEGNIVKITKFMLFAERVTFQIWQLVEKPKIVVSERF